MKSRAAFIVAAICLLNPALAAPAGLLDKTVRISWFQQVPGVAVGTNQSMSAGRAVMVTLYVSSAGRVFAKLASRTGQHTGERTLGPERSAFHAEGTKLVGTLHPAASNGATMITVSFDSSFQSCSLQVILGSENGKPLEWIGLNGARAIATGHPTISSQTCAVSGGNPFAG